MTEIIRNNDMMKSKPTIKQLVAEKQAQQSKLAEDKKRNLKLLDIFSHLDKPLFALLDSASDSKVLSLLQAGDCEYRMLYHGKTAELMDGYAPYLVALPPENTLLPKLIEHGWGQSWGYYFTSDDEFLVFWHHLRRFLSVNKPDNSQVLFRFYDPRVLRKFLPTTIPKELNQFFGNIDAFYLETENRNKLLTYTRTGKMPQKTELLQQSTKLIND